MRLVSGSRDMEDGEYIEKYAPKHCPNQVHAGCIGQACDRTRPHYYISN